ncbi:I78 family peptidase inhibitor [Cognatiyoonia sp. IB215446]|uniref:I78 family peptidase inhibitor n=1 Tax=Cognatiyoonia sp. IB215446 TaxID=3097355 RepID=UPI002A14C6A5|nr:I78 family peptidase inhibitor [Cognatiyoonia sp. IB215446]MDX8346690.1 I78 family peptidase inhibitor [Cognatiyoonia sp. IB215446]
MKRIPLLLLLAACAPASEPLPPTLEDTCGAREYGDLIGQDVTALERVLILGPVRVIRPGDMVTMEFLPDRVNFGISEDEKVIEVSCG